MKQLIITVLLLLTPITANAFDVSALGELPVQHEGRVKPLETVARLYWQRFLGTETGATKQLARAIFTPADALKAKQFRVRSAAVQAMLSLPQREDDLYSYIELLPQLREQHEAYQSLAQKDQNTFTATQKALWDLFTAIEDMTHITATLSLFMPVDEGQASYFSLSPDYAMLQQKVRALAQQKGDDLSVYTPQETQMALLAMRLSAIESTGAENRLLRVIPSPLQEEWVAPWQVLYGGAGTPEMAPIMQHWQGLVLAYHADDKQRWRTEIDALKAASAPYYDSNLLYAEQLYHQLNLINLVLFSYLAVLLLAAFGKTQWGLTVMSFALAQHVLMLALRIAILGRPPVTSLYESVLFVSVVSALIGCVIAAKSRSREGLLVGAGLAAALLAISGVYAGEQDTMAMPIAVLNTNFWLATHVIIITAGYGATLIAGSLAHVALFSRDAAAWKYLQAAALWALLLTTVGTILGGVWADQSWGRFWGWDPKENGALLIVLWLAWVLHARLTKYVGKAGFAALLCFGNPIVALSWFGVNLLNVGLHSYGFTSEAALGLAGFCMGELLLVSWLYFRRRRLAS